MDGHVKMAPAVVRDDGQANSDISIPSAAAIAKARSCGSQ